MTKRKFKKLCKRSEALNLTIICKGGIIGYLKTMEKCGFNRTELTVDNDPMGIRFTKLLGSLN